MCPPLARCRRRQRPWASPWRPKGAVPRQLGLSRAALEANGFEGKSGQVLALPSADGVTVAIGVGDPGSATANDLRSAAAAFARTVPKHAHLATNLSDVEGVDAAAAGQAVAEGVLLASYRYTGLKNDPKNASRLESLTLVSSAKRLKDAKRGAERGRVVAAAATFARELANTPPTHLNAVDIATKAVDLAADAGLAGGGVQQGPVGADGLRRHARRQPRVHRTSPDGQAHLGAEELDRPPRCSSARASCTTRAVSRSRATTCSTRT